MRDEKSLTDWSKPPQGGIDPHRRPKQRPEPSFGRGFLGFLLLTVSPMILGMVFPGFSYIGKTSRVFWFLPPLAGFYFLAGIVVIPFVALFQIRKFGKILAIILRSVNLYIIVSYGVVLSLLATSIRVPFFEKLVQGTMTMFGLGYFAVIIISAAMAAVPTPDPPRPEFDPILEGLEDFHPTDVGRVQDGIARF